MCDCLMTRRFPRRTPRHQSPLRAGDKIRNKTRQANQQDIHRHILRQRASSSRTLLAVTPAVNPGQHPSLDLFSGQDSATAAAGIKLHLSGVTARSVSKDVSVRKICIILLIAIVIIANIFTVYYLCC